MCVSVCVLSFKHEVQPPLWRSHCAFQRHPASLPAYAASTSSEFGRDSAPMSRFPGSAITAIVVTSASDSVSEPTSWTGSVSMGGSSSPSAFVAESASSIPRRWNDKSRMQPSSRGASTWSERSRARYEPRNEPHARLSSPRSGENQRVRQRIKRTSRERRDYGRSAICLFSWSVSKKMNRRLPEEHEWIRSDTQRPIHTHADIVRTKCEYKDNGLLVQLNNGHKRVFSSP